MFCCERTTPLLLLSQQMGWDVVHYSFLQTGYILLWSEEDNILLSAKHIWGTQRSCRCSEQARYHHSNGLDALVGYSEGGLECLVDSPDRSFCLSFQQSVMCHHSNGLDARVGYHEGGLECLVHSPDRSFCLSFQKSVTSLCVPYPAAWAVYALSLFVKPVGLRLYSLSSFGKVRQKARLNLVSIILVGPNWPAQPFYPDLVPLSCDSHQTVFMLTCFYASASHRSALWNSWQVRPGFCAGVFGCTRCNFSGSRSSRFCFKF